jgi:HEAT repeat protein
VIAPRRARALAASALLGLAALGAPASAAAFTWPNVAVEVGRALAAGDVAERRAAATRMRELAPPVVAKLAEKAVADPDVEVRLRVAQAITLFRVARAGDWVVPWLSEGDARLRLAACEVVRAGPTERSVTALGRVLGDPDAHVRFAAAQAMGASGLGAAVSPLLGHLDDAAPEVRAEVARALGRIGDARAVLPLVGKVQDSVPEVRRVVARALGELGDARAASALMLALGDGNAEVRAEAIASLGRLGSDEATVALVPLLDDPADAAATPPGAGRGAVAPASEVRAAALRALGAIGSEAAVKALVAALAKEDPTGARHPARSALVAAGKPAVRALVAALEGAPGPNVAAGAALALGDLGAREGEGAIERAMARGALPLGSGLAALAAMGAPSALPTVLELVGDADPAVRRAAIAAAGALLDASGGDGRAVEPAAAALADPTRGLEERVALVRLLGKSAAPRARQRLADLVKARPVALRLAAIEALGGAGAGAGELDATLLAALDDESAEVRFAAATALARAAAPSTAPALLDRLVAAAEQDRGALGVALAGAMARVKDGALVGCVAGAVASAPDVARDALIEGLGRAPGAVAGAALATLAGSASIDDRRKVAEALAGHADALAPLRALAADPDPSVRAGAAWSLGDVGEAADVALLAPLARDPDGAVAANAAAALGRVATRTGARDGAKEPLCAALGDARPYVRANAITAASLAGVACAEPTLGDVLARDPAEAARVAAADAIARGIAAAPAGGAIPERRALARCAAEERDALVATRCARPLAPSLRPPPSAAPRDVVVYVAPDGRAVPVGRAPFALARPEGLLRLGTADRRGEVFERGVGPGALRLAAP